MRSPPRLLTRGETLSSKGKETRRFLKGMEKKENSWAGKICLKNRIPLRRKSIMKREVEKSVVIDATGEKREVFFIIPAFKKGEDTSPKTAESLSSGRLHLLGRDGAAGS